MRKTISALLTIILTISSISLLAACQSAPSRDEQFFYGDIYFGMLQDDVRELASGSLWVDEEERLYYKSSDAPYTSARSDTTYIFQRKTSKGRELDYIHVCYYHSGTREEIMETLKEALSNDYGTCHKEKNAYGNDCYIWETSLVRIQLDYDETYSYATIFYSRRVFD